MSYVMLILATLVFAIQAVRARRLIGSALWLAGVSGMLSIVLFLLGAFQVAVIELSVGAGLVTVLFVFAIGIAGEETVSASTIVPKIMAFFLSFAAVGLLGWLTFPLNTLETTQIEQSLPEVLWQQRSLDVLVQIVLIFAGVLGILGLLAEVKSPLGKSVAESVAARREQELLALQEQVLQLEEEGV